MTSTFTVLYEDKSSRTLFVCSCFRSLFSFLFSMKGKAEVCNNNIPMNTFFQQVSTGAPKNTRNKSDPDAGGAGSVKDKQCKNKLIVLMG